jgi:ABC-type antimicrobial peptide transport system permease subunit
MIGGLKDKRERLIVLIGAAIGGGLSIVTSLLMDLMFSDSLQGTWRDAISNDLKNYFSIILPPESIIVFFLFLVVLALLAGIGASIGAFFAYIVLKFIRFLES